MKVSSGIIAIPKITTMLPRWSLRKRLIRPENERMTHAYVGFDSAPEYRPRINFDLLRLWKSGPSTVNESLRNRGSPEPSVKHGWHQTDPGRRLCARRRRQARAARTAASG